MTTATHRKTTSTAAASPSALRSAPGQDGPRRRSSILLIGLDLGTNKSCVLAGPPGSTDITVSKVVPSVVGYVKDGIVDGIITGNARILYGEDALQPDAPRRPRRAPREGVIARPEAARDFMQHIRSLADPPGRAEIRAVVGVPANAGEQARESDPAVGDQGSSRASCSFPSRSLRRSASGTTRGSSSRATSTPWSTRSSSTSAAARATSASSRGISRPGTTRSASRSPGDAIDEHPLRRAEPHLSQQRPLAHHRARDQGGPRLRRPEPQAPRHQGRHRRQGPHARARRRRSATPATS